MKFALLAVLAIACFAASVAAQVPIPYDDCGSSSDHITITSATADVWPPPPGQHVHITLIGTLDESVSGGSYIIGVAVDGFPLINTQGSLNDLPNITWPIPAGPINITHRMKLPSILGAGTTVVANLSALDSNGQELICLGLEIVVPSGEEGVEMSSEEYATEYDLSVEPMEMEALNGDAEVAESEEEGGEEEEEAAPSEEDADSLFAPKADIEVVSVTAPVPSFKQIVASLIDIAAGEMQLFAAKLHAEDQLTSRNDVVQVPYKNCGQPTDIITIESITSTVWPPVAGSTATVVASFLVNEQVNGGNYNAQLSVDGFPLVNNNGTLSDFVTLPLATGPFSITKSVTLPATLPFSGSIGVQVSATNEAASELFCLALAFTI